VDQTNKISGTKTPQPKWLVPHVLSALSKLTEVFVGTENDSRLTNKLISLPRSRCVAKMGQNKETPTISVN
jgi:hypothetical protein